MADKGSCVRSVELKIIDGPNFGAIMNSLSAPRIADAFPLDFVVNCYGNHIHFSGKAVGVDCRDVEDGFLLGLRVQLSDRLDEYSPRRPSHVDVILPVYNTHNRSGSVTISGWACKKLGIETRFS